MTIISSGSYTSTSTLTTSGDDQPPKKVQPAEAAPLLNQQPSTSPNLDKSRHLQRRQVVLAQGVDQVDGNDKPGKYDEAYEFHSKKMALQGYLWVNQG